MLPTAPRTAARPIVRVERSIARPFTAVGRVETRAGALVTAAVLALIGVSAALVAANNLGAVIGLSSLGRGVLIGLVIVWILAGDAVEPLGLRLRDVAGSLAGEIDTYRPVAAAWLSAVRAGLLAVLAAATPLLAVTWRPGAAVSGLFVVALLASQAESVARRRAWTLGDASEDRSSGRSLGRDEDLVHALTRGGRGDADAGHHRPDNR